MLRWLRDLVRPECPYCAGESGEADYFGEWYECECCNPDLYSETGRVWLWRLWRYRYKMWQYDRWIERMIRNDVRS